MKMKNTDKEINESNLLEIHTDENKDKNSFKSKNTDVNEIVQDVNNISGNKHSKEFLEKNNRNKEEDHIFIGEYLQNDKETERKSTEHLQPEDDEIEDNNKTKIKIDDNKECDKNEDEKSILIFNDQNNEVESNKLNFGHIEKGKLKCNGIKITKEKNNNKKSMDENKGELEVQENINTNKKIKLDAKEVNSLKALSAADKQKFIDKYKFNVVLLDKFLCAFFTVLSSNIDSTDYDKIAKLSHFLVSDIEKLNKTADNTFIRSKIWNLQDKNNVHAKNLYDGNISSLEYLNLTNEEMKSVNLKSKEEKMMQNSLMDSQFAEIKAETDMFKCGKCKNRKTTYHQLQTRSADEPMTTFVTCVVCKNRWKF